MLLDLIPPAWRPFAKAIVAALLPVLSLLLIGLLANEWDTAALTGAILGALAAIGTIVTRKIPTARTLVAASVVLLGLIVTGLLTGEWNTSALAGALVTVVAALLVHETPNES